MRDRTRRWTDFMDLAASQASDCQIVVSSLQIPVGVTSVFPLPSHSGGGARNLKGRWRIYVKNQRPEDRTEEPTVFLGGANVNQTNGYPLAPQEFIVLDITDEIQLYVIQQTGPQILFPADVRTLEMA